jgi:RNA polymerase sigma factor (sigma-70 family)
MEQPAILPDLFRTEYSKIVAVLCKYFGMPFLEQAEDIASETFLLASNTWGLKGLPNNPTAWLYTVAKNKAIDFIKHNQVFKQKVYPEIIISSQTSYVPEPDLSPSNIMDSQLKMMFAICNPIIPVEAQVGLALNILCGFGADEIAEAFLTNRDVIYKRLQRAKQKLREENITIDIPPQNEIAVRLDAVLTTVYLLFNEGYFSSSQNNALRKDLCIEAMRLNVLLLENATTNTAESNALLALMCFHASRFEARINNSGEMVLYEEQNEQLWNKELIHKGEYYLNNSAGGNQISTYHLEAAIAYWHTHKQDTQEKWENILQLYNKLLQVNYSPIAALNRTYALAKVMGAAIAIKEAEKLKLEQTLQYHMLLGHLYAQVDLNTALSHLKTAENLTKREREKRLLADLQIKLQHLP